MSDTKRWAAGLFIALIFMYNHGGGLAQGETSAKAACVMEMETGRVLFEYNARARLLLHPGDAAALANRRYFETRFSEPKTEQKKEKQG